MWNLLIGSGGSIVAAAIIFLISYWYNSKRQSDAKANEYTRLINEIANLNSKFTIMDTKIDNVDTKFDIIDTKFAILDSKIDNVDTKFAILDSKIDNASEATKNDYTRLMNEIQNLNSKLDIESQTRNSQFNILNEKFDNGFDRFFIEIDKLRTTVEANAEKIEFNTLAIKNQSKDINNLTTIIHDLQMIMLKDMDAPQVS